MHDVKKKAQKVLQIDKNNTVQEIECRKFNCLSSHRNIFAFKLFNKFENC